MLQDFPLPAMVVFNTWKNRKMTQEAAVADLVMCRDYKAIETMARLNDLALRERSHLERLDVEKIQTELRSKQKPYLPHPVVEEYVSGFDKKHMGVRGRWKPLVFLGETDCGKTWKAMSLFPERTLKVSCNGLPSGIVPSLKEFERQKHSAIVFDEIRPDQILGNRELFQSGQWPVKLGQSNCAQHEYSVWLYGIALICCTNSLKVDPASDTYASDREWLEHNLVVVELQPGQKWYLG
jgi:hypothetical protein